MHRVAGLGRRGLRVGGQPQTGLALPHSATLSAKQQERVMGDVSECTMSPGRRLQHPQRDLTAVLLRPPPPWVQVLPGCAHLAQTHCMLHPSVPLWSKGRWRRSWAAAAAAAAARACATPCLVVGPGSPPWHPRRSFTAGVRSAARCAPRCVTTASPSPTSTCAQSASKVGARRHTIRWPTRGLQRAWQAGSLVCVWLGSLPLLLPPCRLSATNPWPTYPCPTSAAVAPPPPPCLPACRGPLPCQHCRPRLHSPGGC